MPDTGWTLEHVALAAADLGAWSYDVQGGQVTWSPRAAELHAIPLPNFGGTMVAVEAAIHPDDRKRVLDLVDRAVSAGPDDFQVEYRVAGHPDRWLAARGRILRDESGAPLRVAGVVQDCTSRRDAEEREAATRQLMHAALEASVFAVVVLEPTGKIIYCNQKAAELLGLTPSTVEGRSYDAPQWKHTALDGGPWPDERQPFVRVMTTRAPVFGVEHAIERPDGRRTALRINGQPIFDDHGDIRLLVFSFEDITERLALEEAHRQSQRMEAIGRLAGGVAHDFNNLLTVISATSELLLASLATGDPMRADVQEVLDAAQRGASLTNQLLAFSRRQVVEPTPVVVDTLLAATTRMLRRLLGEDVELLLDLQAAQARVLLDPSQAGQVFVNLAVNARDAMPRGGKLTFGTRVVELRRGDAPAGSALATAPPGTYVRLTVTDTGVGVAADALPHLFEPFYTTKEKGQGTGLGLSIVYGIVTQAGGCVSVTSAPGAGTTFTIHLPTTTEEAPAKEDAPAPSEREGAATVLLVEDEAPVLQIAARFLRAQGFRVATAPNAAEAIRMVEEGQRAGLLLTDVLMPGLNGRELFERLRQTLPDLRVVFMSGHTNDIISKNGALIPGTTFLPKPFSLADLLRKVRDALER